MMKRIFLDVLVILGRYVERIAKAVLPAERLCDAYYIILPPKGLDIVTGIQETG